MITFLQTNFVAYHWIIEFCSIVWLLFCKRISWLIIELLNFVASYDYFFANEFRGLLLNYKHSMITFSRLLRWNFMAYNWLYGIFFIEFCMCNRKLLFFLSTTGGWVELKLCQKLMILYDQIGSQNAEFLAFA